ncbi:MAG: tetratricopeptide repeat protein [Bacteroidota bacterium]
MEKIFSLCSLYFFALFILSAQNSRVSDGIKAYEKGDYEKAIQHFNEALDQEQGLKSKNRVKAYYYRAKAQLDQLQQFQYQKDQAGTNEYRDAPLAAIRDLAMAASKDQSGRYTKAIRLEQNLLYNPLLREALASIQQAANQADLQAQEASRDRATQYIEEAINIQPQDYLPFDLLGQIALAEQDSMAALFNFAQAIDLYQKYPPQKPDFAIAYTYYHMALLKRHYKQSVEEALRSVQYGQQLLQVEYSRQVDMDANGEQRYQKGLADLKNYELELYLHSPNHQAEAIDRYAQALKSQPNNYDLHLAYAQLLADHDKKQAITIYQKAITIDPSRFIGHFNLGALYHQQAKGYYHEASEASHLEAAKTAKKKGEMLMEKALKAFEQAHLIQPKSPTSLQHICTIAHLLERGEICQQYQLASKE